MMKNMKKTIVVLAIALGWMPLAGQFVNPLELVESAGTPCGQLSNCSANRLCFDIWVTPDTTAILQSYNIWLQYVNTGLNYLSDAACITSNGMDNNLNSQGYYRVAGILGVTTVVEDVPVKLHNICFTYPSAPELEGEIVIVGGSVFGSLHSTITFNSPPANEPTMPTYPTTLTEENVSCILPVKWLTFEASKRGETSLLEWTTAEEFNNKGFDVLRSADGQHFEKIGWVDAYAAPQAINQYQLVDHKPFRGVNYYQLRQWDYDGKSALSPIRTVTFHQSNFFVAVTPNPAKEFFFVEIRTEIPESEVTLIDVTGKVVMSEKVRNDEINSRVSIDHLAAGVYTILVTSGPDRFIDQLVIMH
jgi:hypothetical protein